jgi:hypothetical protein
MITGEQVKAARELLGSIKDVRQKQANLPDCQPNLKPQKCSMASYGGGKDRNAGARASRRKCANWRNLSN